MDLYVERQCVEQMKKGDLAKFMLLFEDNFANVYKFIYRRVDNLKATEDILRMTFLDALGQIQSTPSDSTFVVWLYSLAKPRVWRYLEKNGFPQRQGLIYKDELKATLDPNLIRKSEKIFSKLSLEEREILRLKFLEEVSDADVLTILGGEDHNIGSKIYRVFKRAHFLLFGENKEGQAVYFGELSGFMARLKAAESIEIKEVSRISMKTEIQGKIDKRDFAIDVEEQKDLNKKTVNEPSTGSNDPAKIFVQAVKEMREEEEMEKIKQQLKEDKTEEIYEYVEERKASFILIPLVIFLFVVSFIGYQLFFEIDIFSKIFDKKCDIEVAFDENFIAKEKEDINENINKRICNEFEVKTLAVDKIHNKKIEIHLETSDEILEYEFKKVDNIWKINEYEKIANSNQEPREV